MFFYTVGQGADWARLLLAKAVGFARLVKLESFLQAVTVFAFCLGDCLKNPSGGRLSLAAGGVGSGHSL